MKDSLNNAPLIYSTREDNLVLVIDDNSFNVFAVQSLLKQYSLEADVAEDAQQAIQKVQQRLAASPGVPFYRLILMDYSMPVTDGPDCWLKLRELIIESPQQEQIPRISCLTAHQLGECRDRALAAGMDDYLLKPISQEELSGLLSKAGVTNSP